MYTYFFFGMIPWKTAKWKVEKETGENFKANLRNNR
jgi:hypothetical protein